MASDNAKIPSGLIFVGPPGAGKGTQADLLKRRFDNRKICHLSTGDMLRAAITAGTPLGKKVKPILDSGGLVDDDTMITLVREAVNEPPCKDGFILDGFPRTVGQAQKLDHVLENDPRKIDRVIEFDIEDQLVVDRVCGRRIHKSSGRTYHILFNPPKVTGKDDVTGEDLIRRSDDNEEALRVRLNAFHTQTTPVISYYKNQGKVTTVDASKSVNDVFATMMSSFK